MARSFCSTKTANIFIANEISAYVTKRGYAAAAINHGGVVASRSGANKNPILTKGGEDSKTTSWVPDPVTGFYRPENKAREVDAAVLREMLVKNKNRGGH